MQLGQIKWVDCQFHSPGCPASSEAKHRALKELEIRSKECVMHCTVDTSKCLCNLYIIQKCFARVAHPTKQKQKTGNSNLRLGAYTQWSFSTQRSCTAGRPPLSERVELGWRWVMGMAEQKTLSDVVLTSADGTKIIVAGKQL